MLLADALQELTTQLDVLCATTQGRLFTRLARQLSRLTQCEDALRAAVLVTRQTNKDRQRERETLTRELDDARAKHNKLLARTQRERQDRSEEKEWLAALWPDAVVLPTILKPYAPVATDGLLVSQVELQAERERLTAMVNRRAARERVLQQMEAAAQWRMVVVPPSTSPEGEYVATQTYYHNAETGETTWEAPVAMFYEPPVQWDHKKIDWKDSYALDAFYPVKLAEAETVESPGVDPQSPQPTGRAPIHPAAAAVPMAPQATVVNASQDSDDDDDDDDDGEEDDERVDQEIVDNVAATSRTRPTARTDRSGDDDGETEPPDPAVLRVALDDAFARAAQLQEQLTKSEGEQRSLALQLLNATRESFEREKETLAHEDALVKDAERQRRKAQQEEAAAAKAKALAQERRALEKTVQPSFARGAVAKKDLTLAKDDELLERELEAFAIEQRRDRLYLAAPLASDERVKFRHQWDDEFVHMRHVEEQLLVVEQTEFELLEKTALRLEEATKRREEITVLLENARTTQREVDDELVDLPQRIAVLEEARPPPEEPRPGDDVLARARERFIGVEDAAESGRADEALEAVEGEDAEERQQDKPGEDAKVEAAEEEGEESGEEEEDEDGDGNNGDMDTAPPGPALLQEEPVDPEALARDEAELKLLRDAVALDRAWRDWETAEVLRLEDLAATYDYFRALETTQRRLVVDVALLQSSLQFVEQLVVREKQAHDMLWDIQARSQVERARFLIERAVREESLFQVHDEYAAVTLRLEVAQRLPRQARSPLEKLELLETSKRQAQDLQQQLTQLRSRCEKELAAKQLLMALETRFCAYSQSKLHEEATLFAEKQALWDLNATLLDELRMACDKVDSLYSQLRGDSEAADAEVELRAQYEEASAVFQEKLQRIEAARQFLLLCYERELRWRSLAAVALIKDTTSDAWMTAMQRERQDAMLATLQQQHEQELLALRREIKLLGKVKALLQQEIADRDTKLERVRGEYQRSSDAVRRETEQIVLGLNAQLQQEEDARAAERKRAQDDRARLIEDHEKLTTELQQRIAEQQAENDQQRHWLTAARRELHAQRVANDALLVAYQSLEKRRATETNDMRFRIGSQITKINGIEMWNLSLKIQAREAHAERVKMQREVETLVRHHRHQQRLLRLANWRHRVAAQQILTDVETLFAFFAHGLEIVAGATRDANDALRRNGGIEVLASLAQHSSQSTVRVIAAKALGEISWNANATPRALGWKANKCWGQYVERLSNSVLQSLAEKGVEFDSVASESSSAMNWFADTSERDAVDRHEKKLRFLQRWNARDDVERPDVNSDNQEYIGLAPGVLKTVVDLCSPARVRGDPEQDDEVHEKIQRNALRSLAIIAMHTRNTAIVGRMDGCIPLLVGLLRARGTATAVVCHAIHALANLAFQNRYNQLAMCHAGAIPLLLANASCHGDVDVLLASVQALAHLSFENRVCCEAVFDGDGLAVLTRLCHSFRIHDAIDLDVFETIQTRAAETIANVITTLDGDADPPPQQQEASLPAVDRNVASAILDASHLRGPSTGTEDAPGVATFVLMCASCTRDVAFDGALVLGSLAQHDNVRAAIGANGGVDALFLLARGDDLELVAQATWALANATWNRENQYRVARYLDPLYELATFASSGNNHNNNNSGSEEDAVAAAQIREHALCIVANALFYNDANRQLVGSHTAWMTLLPHTCRTASGPSLDHAARAMCALSYSDALALALGGHDSVAATERLAAARSVNGLELFVRLCGRADSAVAQTHGLYGLINLCLHDANKAALLAVPHAIETLVNLSGSTNRQLCDPAMEALELLADVRQATRELVGTSPAAVLSASTMNALAATDLKKLLAMLEDATATPALLAMASDAIADEVWKKPSAKVRLRNEHGLETLLALCVGGPQTPLPLDSRDGERVVLSCLWALRNSVSENARNQDHVGALDAIPRLVALAERHRHRHDVVEAVLAVLVALVMTHPRNSQELVHHGVDLLVTLADGGPMDHQEEEEETRRDHRGGASVPSPSKKSTKDTVGKPPSQANRALARELLLLLAPYNTTVLPPLVKPSSPEKSRMPKKPPHVALPSLVSSSSPLAASVSPTKRPARSNN